MSRLAKTQTSNKYCLSSSAFGIDAPQGLNQA